MEKISSNGKLRAVAIPHVVEYPCSSLSRSRFGKENVKIARVLCPRGCKIGTKAAFV